MPWKRDSKDAEGEMTDWRSASSEALDDAELEGAEDLESNKLVFPTSKEAAPYKLFDFLEGKVRVLVTFKRDLFLLILILKDSHTIPTSTSLLVIWSTKSSARLQEFGNVFILSLTKIY